MEFKVKALDAAPEVALESAAKQVREKRYVEALHAAGVERVDESALAFDGKRCLSSTSTKSANLACSS